MSSKNKKTIIESWLKKKKKGSSILGTFNKRWFALDIVNAVFTYSSGKNKKPNKTIPLRDIISLEVVNDPVDRDPKEWEHNFIVNTKERPFSLFA